MIKWIETELTVASEDRKCTVEYNDEGFILNIDFHDSSPEQNQELRREVSLVQIEWLTERCLSNEVSHGH